jgi:hypothetical protein
MAISLIADTEAKSTNTTSVTTPAANMTGATCFGVWEAHDGSQTSLTDSEGNTGYTAVINQLATARLEGRVKTSPTVSSSMTFSLDPPGAGFPSLSVIGLAGTAASPVDQSSSANASQPGSITPTENNEWILTGGAYNNTNSPTVDSPFSTNQYATLVGDANAYGLGAARDEQTTATARNPTWSSSGNPTGQFSLKAAAVAATFIPIVGRGPGMALAGRGGLAA